MTKENLTSINVVIDRSGSMAGLVTDTVGGYNAFLDEQRKVEGEATVTLCLFNTTSQIVYDGQPLSEIPNLDARTYYPSGGTALNDALGSTIDTVGAKLAALPEEERPSKVIFLVVTDGQENSSRNYTQTQVKEKVEHQKSVYNWEFVFMGANIDAVQAGTSLGVSAANSLNYTADSRGTRQLYSTVSSSMNSYRASKSRGPVDFFNGAAPVTPATPVSTTPGLGSVTPQRVTTTTTTTTTEAPVSSEVKSSR